MILEIRLSNFFSIKDEITLDLRAGNIKTQKVKTLSNNVFEFEKNKVLKTVALYGANASGKSNIIKAIRFCNSMVFSSHQHNENAIFNFQPFKFKGFQKKPSYYFIRFVSNDIEYEYAFSLTRTEILTESLYYFPKGRKAKIFSRDESLGKTKKDKYSFGSVIKRPMDVAENTSNKTLYISRASQMDRIVGKEIFNFFSTVFILGYRGFNANSVENLFNKNKDQLLQALKMADSDIVDIKTKKELQKVKNLTANFSTSQVSVEDKLEPQLRIITYHKSSPKIPFDFNSEESSGTKKMLFIMLTILDIVKNNKILMIDEIEDSLHTNIIEYIIEIFNASGQAQLIYTTHNTNLLNLNKLRKDQIYFVNKKEDASTDLYSLYDYKDFRDTMDVEKAYLQGRFDAIPFIDDSIENIKSIINE
ncbi:MAG: ATP-binding protein [Flavobacteriaceae bacterium]|nr:ATP-binding protein [Flavobacteriaceae bacterium]